MTREDFSSLDLGEPDVKLGLNALGFFLVLFSFLVQKT